MDTFEINKIIGAVLGASLIVFVINEAGEVLMTPAPLEKNAYPVAAVAEEKTPTAEVAKAEAKIEAPAAAEKTPAIEAVKAEAPKALSGVAALLGTADADAGRKAARKCVACHGFDKGGRNKVGPNLWGVVGRAVAGVSGYKYSGTMAKAGGSWGYDELDRFLAAPKKFMKGTKMSFAGVKKEGDRANLIAFLRSLSDSPIALPGSK